MSLFNHSHHWMPFEDDTRDAGFADPVGDRRELKEMIGRLRRQVAERDADIMRLTRERDHWQALAERRRWLRRG